MLVACYKTKRGERLWSRRIVLDPARGTFLPVRLRVSKRAVVVTLSPSYFFTVPETLVLLFDAKDGTGP